MKKEYHFQQTISVASEALINQLSYKFRQRGGKFINDEAGWYYLDARKAEAITLNGYTIVIRQQISISTLLEELEHAEQYMRGEITGDRLSVVKNEIAAKKKSIATAHEYQLPHEEVQAVKKQISIFEEELRRLSCDENYESL